MDDKLAEKLINDLIGIKENLGEKKASQLNIKQLERIIQRLGDFSRNCSECEGHLLELHNWIAEYKGNSDALEELELKEIRDKAKAIMSHLQKEHKLVTEGFYLSIYLSVGVSIGLVFGFLLFDNMVLGLPIGIAFGIAIGAGLDADAKKKGRSI